jgi:cytochrome-b5 reductase
MSSAFSPQYINGVYIPAGLLIVGTAIVKQEWLPFAVALAAVLGAYKVFSNGQSYAYANITRQ